MGVFANETTFKHAAHAETDLSWKAIKELEKYHFSLAEDLHTGFFQSVHAKLFAKRAVVQPDSAEKQRPQRYAARSCAYPKRLPA